MTIDKRMSYQYTGDDMTSRKSSHKKNASNRKGLTFTSGKFNIFVKRGVLGFVALVYSLALNIYALGSIYSYVNRDKPVTLGMSFSANQARNFGVDPKENLKWLVEKQGFKNFRLMSYWSDVEKTEGQFDFSDLEWQLDYLNTVPGASVSLAIGMRQPRWPECHVPSWLDENWTNTRTEYVSQKWIDGEMKLNTTYIAPIDSATTQPLTFGRAQRYLARG